MKPVRLEPAAPRSRVKHSNTEPLGSLVNLIASVMEIPNILQTSSCLVVCVFELQISHFVNFTL